MTDRHTAVRRMKPTETWALLRDDVLHSGDGSLAELVRLKGIYEPGSKHKWRVARVLVTELPKRRQK